MLAGESATTIARRPCGWSSAYSIAEHAAPRLADDGVAAADPEVAVERDELALEQLAVQKSAGASGQVLALAAAELVVEDAGRGRTGDRSAIGST